jgi:hypothetical protein
LKISWSNTEPNKILKGTCTCVQHLTELKNVGFNSSPALYISRVSVWLRQKILVSIALLVSTLTKFKDIGCRSSLYLIRAFPNLIALGSVWDCGSGCGQSVFRLKIHQNDVFLFFKKYFYDQHIKTISKYKKKLTKKN